MSDVRTILDRHEGPSLREALGILVYLLRP